MSENSQRYHPFSNGTQFLDWEDRNCCRCALYHDGPIDEAPCELDRALGDAQMDDGTVSREVADGLGFLDNRDRYTWPCKKRITTPGLCRSCEVRMRRPIQHERATSAAERRAASGD